jgi:hypothetical protein
MLSHLGNNRNGARGYKVLFPLASTPRAECGWHGSRLGEESIVWSRTRRR